MVTRRNRWTLPVAVGLTAAVMGGPAFIYFGGLRSPALSAYEKVRSGMTEQQVDALLGTGYRGTGTASWFRKRYDRADATVIVTFTRNGSLDTQQPRWVAEGKDIQRRSFLDRVRLLLHW